MKIPKHITDAIGRPRCICPKCHANGVEITGKGTLGKHREHRGSLADWCKAVGEPAPDGAVLAWLRKSAAVDRTYAAAKRDAASEATRHAESLESRAAELEKLIERAEKSAKVSK